MKVPDGPPMVLILGDYLSELLGDRPLLRLARTDGLHDGVPGVCNRWNLLLQPVGNGLFAWIPMACGDAADLLVLVEDVDDAEVRHVLNGEVGEPKQRRFVVQGPRH